MPILARFFFGSQDRVLAMSLIHETLYQSNHMTCINFASYVRHLVSSLSRAYAAEQTVDFNLNCDTSATVSTNLAVPLGADLKRTDYQCLKTSPCRMPEGIPSPYRFVLSLTMILSYPSHNLRGIYPKIFLSINPLLWGCKLSKVLTQKIGAKLTIQQPSCNV